MSEGESRSTSPEYRECGNNHECDGCHHHSNGACNEEKIHVHHLHISWLSAFNGLQHAQNRGLALIDFIHHIPSAAVGKYGHGYPRPAPQYARPCVGMRLAEANVTGIRFDSQGVEVPTESVATHPHSTGSPWPREAAAPAIQAVPSIRK